MSKKRTLKPYDVTDPADIQRDPLCRALVKIAQEGGTPPPAVIISDVFEDEENGDKVVRVSNPATGAQHFMEPIPHNHWAFEEFMEIEGKVQKDPEHKLRRVSRESTYEVARAYYHHSFPRSLVKVDTPRHPLTGGDTLGHGTHIKYPHVFKGYSLLRWTVPRYGLRSQRRLLPEPDGR